MSCRQHAGGHRGRHPAPGSQDRGKIAFSVWRLVFPLKACDWARKWGDLRLVSWMCLLCFFLGKQTLVCPLCFAPLPCQPHQHTHSSPYSQNPTEERVEEAQLDSVLYFWGSLSLSQLLGVFRASFHPFHKILLGGCNACSLSPWCVSSDSSHLGPTLI